MHFVSQKVRVGGIETLSLGLLVSDRFHSKTEVSRESGCVSGSHAFPSPSKERVLGEVLPGGYLTE